MTEYGSPGGARWKIGPTSAFGGFAPRVSGRAGAILLLALLLGTGLRENLRAVPACPAPVTVRQPDGRTIRLFLRGDEFLHWAEDSSGYTVVREPSRGWWVYAERAANGSLVAGAHAVGSRPPAELGLARRLLTDRDTARARAAAATRRRTPGGPIAAANASPAATPRAPRIGTMRNLVVLVAFSDKAFTYTRAQFDALFNTIGYATDGAVGSVKDYYHEVSYYALTVNSVVVDAVTLDHGYAYYGANDAWGWDIRPREMVAEALAKLEARGFDFSTMDNDSDGWVDGLTIIHAGGAEEYGGNDPDYIWSHQWELESPVTYDGKQMQTYHTEPERRGWDDTPSSQGITRIGVICHENGHFLGLPDLYDYGYDSAGVGNFCLMAGGSWNGTYGTQPAHMSAWCKSTLGWATPTVVDIPGVYSVPRVEDNATVYRLSGTFPSTQYFLIENRQDFGFDASLPGTTRGLLIWHVDETRSDNNDQTHYLVDLEEASGTQHLEDNTNSGNDADYFRSGTMTIFNASTTPNNRSYAGTALGLDISAVSAAGSPMTFTIPSVLAAPTNMVASDGLYTNRVALSWSALTNASWYRPLRALVPGGPKTALSGWIAATSFDDVVMTPGILCYYSVQGATSSNGTDASAASAEDGGWRRIAPPQGVLAGDGLSTAVVSVAWSAPVGASYYRVYRAATLGGTKIAISGWIAATNYDDATATPGIVSYYSVEAAATASGGRPSDVSAEDSGWRALAAPGGLTASDGTYTNFIRINWNSVSGGSYYRVYRASTPGGARTAASGWIAALTFDDASSTPGTLLYYSVQAATDASGAGAGFYSAEDSGWRPASPPSGVAASDGTTSECVRVTWAPIGGDPYYRVHRGTTAGGAKSAVSGWIQGTNYADSSATPGTNYYYAVQAAADAGGSMASGLSAEDAGWRAVPPPTSVSAADGTDPAATRVLWLPPLGASHYRVGRGASPGTSRTPLTGWITGTYYDDTTGTPGTPYYYAVQGAIDGSGTRPGDWSAEDAGWRQIPGPATIVAADGLSTANVSVAWSTVSGATYYRAYRAATAGGAKTAIGSWSTATNFSDAGGTPGAVYYYSAQAATASDGLGAGAYSSEDSGWRLLAPPAGVTAGDGLATGPIPIYWRAVTGATHYAVYRGATPGGATNPVGNPTWITSTNSSDTPSLPRGVPYYYSVRAATSSSGGRSSDYSAEDVGWRCLTAPATVAATDGTLTGFVRVTWSTVSGAGAYRVYRAATTNGAKTPVSAWVVTTNADDSTVSAEVVYYFSVQAAATAAGERPGLYSAEDAGRSAGEATTAMGTPLSWLGRYGLGSDMTDPDGDGRYTWQEYLIGSNPTSADLFRVQSCEVPGGTRAVLRWPSSTNGSLTPYVIQSRTNLLLGAWGQAGLSPRTPPLNAWTSGPGPAACYRVAVTNAAP